MEELGDQCKVVFAYFVTGNTTAHIQTPKVIKEFYSKEWACICPSYKHFPPTPCFVHRVDAKPPVFI